jgi:L-ascorbate metabolism protein UlaG (beta-lactamase superfamily)
VPSLPRLVYVGHATVLIELDGLRFVTDPLIGRRVLHLSRRVGIDIDQAVAGIDAVLISHVHYDHLDRASLRRFRKGTTVVAPRGSGHLLRRFEDVREVEVGDETQIGEVVVRATPADHAAFRPTVRASASLGYLLAGSRRVYFAGDTDLFEGMAELSESLDVALLPVAGWGPRLPPGHLTPETAAKALQLLRPKLAVPIHWGTFSLPGRPAETAAPEEFRRLAAEHAPEVEVRILEPADATTF